MQASIKSVFYGDGQCPNARRIRDYTWLLILGWTVLLGASCYWNISEHKRVLHKVAMAEARAAIGRDLLYRRWVSSQGGIYVQATEKMPPNPYLAHVPERDIRTPSGKILTLVNPAYMTRKVYELARKQASFVGRGHLTSLKPLRPENVPDPWEEKVLRSFDQGATEGSEIGEIDGQPYMRLMRPFVTDSSCLKCHAPQGYQVDDVRGGLSVSIPIQPLIDATRMQVSGTLATHGVLWLLGLGVVGLGGRRLSAAARTQYQIETELHQQALQMEEEIAERVAVQEELEQLNRSLEEHVDAAVSDLRRKDQILIQQSRLAAMGEMINNIAHQWRQPLNNIGLIIQNLRLSYSTGSISQDEMESEISKAMAVIMHMSRTIDDFRNFFRADKEKRDFVVNKAVSRTLEFVSAALESRNVQVVVESEGEVVTTGYQNEYAQVLLNVISNASEASVERRVKEPRIAIRISRVNGRSLVCIRDNCGGIPDEIMPKIFDPYFTTRAPDKGTGIGLYMSKVIIEQNMGGNLTARNVEGGAEFRIEV